jgi:hypothetical protein
MIGVLLLATVKLARGMLLLRSLHEVPWAIMFSIKNGIQSGFNAAAISVSKQTKSD